MNVTQNQQVFKLAILADIHGNSQALKNVLADIDRRGITNIVNLGDSLYGPLEPAAAADILIGRNIPSICGNEDRILIEETIAVEHSPSLKFTKSQLNREHLEWLKQLPNYKIVFNDFFMFHGTPSDDTEYLLHTICNGQIKMKNHNDIISAVDGIEQKYILCGHDHTPNIYKLEDGRIIINPGSVGCPAYYDDTDPVHSVETSNPFAQYSVFTKTADEVSIENVSVTYDWERAAELAVKNGRKDWFNYLKYGRV